MLTYEQWDAIADSYIPVLALLWVLYVLLHCKQQGFKGGVKIFLATFMGIVLIYALMFLDHALHIWPSFMIKGQNLDYSTHTALAWALLVPLMFINKPAFWTGMASMILYALLMLYQNYHSLADIITTSLAALPILYTVHLKAQPQGT